MFGWEKLGKKRRWENQVLGGQCKIMYGNAAEEQAAVKNPGLICETWG